MTIDLLKECAAYQGRRVAADIAGISRALELPRCPADYDIELRQALAESIAVASPHLDLHEQLERDLPGIIDILIPAYSSEQFELAAQWPQCWEMHEEFQRGEPVLPLRAFLTLHLYAAFDEAAREVFPSADQLPAMFDTTPEAFALTRQVTEHSNMPLWEAVEAAKAAATLPGEWHTMLFERAADLGFWRAFAVVERIRCHLGA